MPMRAGDGPLRKNPGGTPWVGRPENFGVGSLRANSSDLKTSKARRAQGAAPRRDHVVALAIRDRRKQKTINEFLLLDFEGAGKQRRTITCGNRTADRGGAGTGSWVCLIVGAGNRSCVRQEMPAGPAPRGKKPMDSAGKKTGVRLAGRRDWGRQADRPAGPVDPRGGGLEKSWKKNTLLARPDKRERRGRALER